MTSKTAPADTLQNFDHAPNSALLSIPDICKITRQSRASIYRHNKAGRLPFVKLNKSTRATVGAVRKLIGATA